MRGLLEIARVTVLDRDGAEKGRGGAALHSVGAAGEPAPDSWTVAEQIRFVFTGRLGRSVAVDDRLSCERGEYSVRRVEPGRFRTVAVAEAML